MKYIKYTLAIVSFLFLILPQTSIFSQTFSAKDAQKQFNISHFPKYPGPNEKISAEIISYAFDVDRSYITWTLNGEMISQGRGLKRIDFTNGNLGDSMSLYISVVTNDGLSVSQGIEFKVVDVDLLWEADSHTPIFYKGKAVPVSGSIVKITTIPQGFDSMKNLVYRWERDFVYDSRASGVDKNTYSIKFTDIFGGETIGVTVSDQQNRQIFQKSIKIKRGEPEILFYEEDPLEGPLYQRTILGSLELAGQLEIVIRAEPYFFPNGDFFDLLRIWKMNNEKVEPFSNPNFIGLTVPEDIKGEALIELKVNNPNSYFQTVDKKIKLLF